VKLPPPPSESVLTEGKPPTTEEVEADELTSAVERERLCNAVLMVEQPT
jgi:hypothetical protein